MGKKKKQEINLTDGIMNQLLDNKALRSIPRYYVCPDCGKRALLTTGYCKKHSIPTPERLGYGFEVKNKEIFNIKDASS